MELKAFTPQRSLWPQESLRIKNLKNRLRMPSNKNAISKLRNGSKSELST